MMEKRSTKGYTLLFAVIVSTVVLAIAAFILSVSRKQFILSSAARDSIVAFYAADSGIECAVLNYSNNIFATSSESESKTISCNGNTWTPNPSVVSTVNAATTTFYLPVVYVPSGAPKGACTQVVVANVTNGNNSTTTIEARGYNIGWDGADCSETGPRKVERGLRLIYH